MTFNVSELIDRYGKHCTDRQRVILVLSLNGWSSRMIANEIGYSHTTVLDDLSKAMVTVRRIHEQETAA